jgi:imidazolonepropionase-like amidohydrolase
VRVRFLLLLLLLAGNAPAADTAFLNVNVLTMRSERPLTNRTVVVSDGRIARIGPVDATPVPESARVIDGTDRWLIPGLAELHAHVPPGNSPALERVLTLYVANGVTTVRGMLGEPSHLELRRALDAGERFGPRLFTSGPSFNGESVSSVEDAIAMVREQHAAGYDFLKIHPGLSRAEFDAVAATANELGVRFAGHVPSAVGVEVALDAGMASIDHLDGYLQALVPPNVDPSGGLGGFFGLLLAGEALEARIRPLAERTAGAGAWVVPTETLFEHVVSAVEPEEMAAWPEMRYMPRATVAQWVEAKRGLTGDPAFDPELATRAIEQRRSLILALHEAGAGLLLGSDSPQIFNVPGFSVHRELALLVAAGLTPYEALATGTVHAAAFFGRAGMQGVIEPGAVADLVLLDDDPLADIANTRRIHGVMLRGRWLSREELDERLARLAN